MLSYRRRDDRGSFARRHLHFYREALATQFAPQCPFTEQDDLRYRSSKSLANRSITATVLGQRRVRRPFAMSSTRLDSTTAVLAVEHGSKTERWRQEMDNTAG